MLRRPRPGTGNLNRKERLKPHSGRLSCGPAARFSSGHRGKNENSSLWTALIAATSLASLGAARAEAEKPNVLPIVGDDGQATGVVMGDELKKLMSS